METSTESQFHPEIYNPHKQKSVDEEQEVREREREREREIGLTPTVAVST
jgi:hypothetical protein